MNLLITWTLAYEPVSQIFCPHHNLRSSLKCHAQGKEMVKSVVEPIATLPTEAYPSFQVAQSKGLLVHHKVTPWHFIDQALLTISWCLSLMSYSRTYHYNPTYSISEQTICKC